MSFLHLLLLSSLALKSIAIVSPVFGNTKPAPVKVTTGDGNLDNSTGIARFSNPLNVTGNSSNSTTRGRKLFDFEPVIYRNNIISYEWKSSDSQQTYDVFAWSSDCLGLADFALIGNYTDSNGVLHENASIDHLNTDFQTIFDSLTESGSERRLKAYDIFANHTASLYATAAATAKDILDHTITHTSSNDHLAFFQKPDYYLRSLIDYDLLGGGDAGVAIILDVYQYLYKDSDEWNKLMNSGKSYEPLHQEWQATSSTRLSLADWQLAIGWTLYVQYLYSIASAAAERLGSAEGRKDMGFLAGLAHAVLATSFINLLAGFQAAMKKGQMAATPSTVEEVVGDGATAGANTVSFTPGQEWPFRMSLSILQRFIYVRFWNDTANADNVPKAAGSFVNLRYSSEMINDVSDEKKVCN